MRKTVSSRRSMRTKAGERVTRTANRVRKSSRGSQVQTVGKSRKAVVGGKLVASRTYVRTRLPQLITPKKGTASYFAGPAGGPKGRRGRIVASKVRQSSAYVVRKKPRGPVKRVVCLRKNRAIKITGKGKVTCRRTPGAKSAHYYKSRSAGKLSKPSSSGRYRRSMISPWAQATKIAFAKGDIKSIRDLKKGSVGYRKVKAIAAGKKSIAGGQSRALRSRTYHRKRLGVSKGSLMKTPVDRRIAAARSVLRAKAATAPRRTGWTKASRSAAAKKAAATRKRNAASKETAARVRKAAKGKAEATRPRGKMTRAQLASSAAAGAGAYRRPAVRLTNAQKDARDFAAFSAGAGAGAAGARGGARGGRSGSTAGDAASFVRRSSRVASQRGLTPGQKDALGRANFSL
jgi:hypothetical protein